MIARPSDALLKGLRGAAPVGADATDDGAILHEILRLEPVVGELRRVTRAPLTVDTATGPKTIPAGEAVQLQLRHR